MGDDDRDGPGRSGDFAVLDKPKEQPVDVEVNGHVDLVAMLAATRKRLNQP